MSADIRPGGLTALAVLNFVYAGFNALALFSYGVVGLVVNHFATSPQTKDSPKFNTTDVHEASVQLLLGVAAAFVCMVLLIASGVGMLKQRRVLGRYVGSAYAIIAVLYHAYSLYGMHVHQVQQHGAAVHAAAAVPVSILSIIFFVYPLVLLFLVNTTFRDDLVN